MELSQAKEVLTKATDALHKAITKGSRLELVAAMEKHDKAFNAWMKAVSK